MSNIILRVIYTYIKNCLAIIDSFHDFGAKVGLYRHLILQRDYILALNRLIFPDGIVNPDNFVDPTNIDGRGIILYFNSKIWKLFDINKLITIFCNSNSLLCVLDLDYHNSFLL